MGFVPAVTLPVASTVTLRYVAAVTPLDANAMVTALDPLKLVPDNPLPIVRALVVVPPATGVDQKSPPDPLVLSTCPLVPSEGNTYVVDPAIAGATRLTAPDVDPEILSVPLILRAS